jgi:dTDP-4-amino-4,6-dideoxygalactose transaminase
MTRVPYLDLGRLQRELEDELGEALRRVMASGRYVLGPEVAAFEAEWAAYCGAAHCVGVGNGLNALELVLRAWGVGPGDEVVVPSNTYIATWLAVTHVGATPVPVEPDPRTCNLDPARVEAALTPRTRALLPVHLYGQCADLGPLLELARERGLAVVDDAAQAHGARLGELRVGALCDATAFSFYPTKNLGALGDGGAVVTDDESVASRVRRLRSYGEAERYTSVEYGRNSRLDALQAAALRVKLPRLEAWGERRRELAHRYGERLAGSGLGLPVEAPGTTHAWHLYVVRSPERDRLREALAARGVDSLVHYPRALHEHPAYTALARPALASSEQLAREVLSLPLYPQLRDDEHEAVCAAITEVTA